MNCQSCPYVERERQDYNKAHIDSLYLICCLLKKRLNANHIEIVIPDELRTTSNKEHKERSLDEYICAIDKYISEHISGEIKKEIGNLMSTLTNSVYEKPYDNTDWCSLKEIKVDEMSKENLLAIIKEQSLIIKRQQILIDKVVKGCNINTPNPTDATGDMRDFIAHNRIGEKVAPFQSNIDLREDIIIKQEDKGNGDDASIDPKRFRHTMIDILRVLYCLWKLDYFVEFNPDINSIQDFNLQKKAKFKDVLYAFGNALNRPELYKVYDNQFAKSFSENEDLLRIVFDEDMLRVFDRLRNVMKKEIEIRKDKRAKKK